MSGSIVWIDASTPAGNVDNTAGQTGAPACPGTSTAVLYFVPSRCSAFEVARSGMRSKYSPALARTTVLPSPGAYAAPKRGDTLFISTPIGAGNHCTT